MQNKMSEQSQLIDNLRLDNHRLEEGLDQNNIDEDEMKDLDESCDGRSLIGFDRSMNNRHKSRLRDVSAKIDTNLEEAQRLAALDK